MCSCLNSKIHKVFRSPQSPLIQPGPSPPYRPGATAAHQPTKPNLRLHPTSRQPVEWHTPSVLVVGTSMSITWQCIAARASATLEPTSRMLHPLPSCWVHSTTRPSTLVLEAGINDLKNQQLKVLKQDFVSLVDRLLDTGKGLIAGLLPLSRYGDVTTSRLHQPHLWLKGYCLTKSIPFVDNFAAFLKRPHLFKRDGLHPNQEGSRLVSVNLTVCSCTTPTPWLTVDTYAHRPSAPPSPSPSPTYTIHGPRSVALRHRTIFTQSNLEFHTGFIYTRTILQTQCPENS